jgi:hypothetical protein
MINPVCAHWFLFPLVICGVLTGSEIVAWLRRKIDVFDPRAIVGILWFHNTFLAPLLHVTSDFHTPLFDRHVADWRVWFGWMAFVNAPSLIVFRICQSWAFARSRPVRTNWVSMPGRFGAMLSCAICISIVATLYVLIQYGGLQKEDSLLGDPSELIHLSWLLMLADPLLILVLLAVVRLLEAPRRTVRSLFSVLGLLVLLLIGQWFILGMRGSRSALLFALFIGAGFCHYRLRFIPLWVIILSTVFMGVGGYYYAFYKRFGVTGLEAVRDASFRDALAFRAGISPIGVVLGDLSRAEVQALILRRLNEDWSDYQLRMGRTYVASVLTFVPRAIWPNKPSDYLGKVAAGTDLQFGAGSFKPHRFKSSRVYGLGGEAMLNFGAVGVPVAYGLFGWLLGWYRKKVASLAATDARWYLIPVFTLMVFTFAFGDSDNALFLFLKNGVLLAVAVLCSSAIMQVLPTRKH